MCMSVCNENAVLGQEFRWTMEQKQEYTRFLRNALRQHRGKDTRIGGEVGSSRP